MCVRCIEIFKAAHAHKQICFIHRIILHIFMSVGQSCDLILELIGGNAAAEQNILICLHALFQEKTILHIKLTSIISSHQQKQCSRQEWPFEPLSSTRIHLRKMFFFIICLAWSFEISLLASSTCEINLKSPVIFHCYWDWCSVILSHTVLNNSHRFWAKTDNLFLWYRVKKTAAL